MKIFKTMAKLTVLAAGIAYVVKRDMSDLSENDRYKADVKITKLKNQVKAGVDVAKDIASELMFNAGEYAADLKDDLEFRYNSFLNFYEDPDSYEDDYLEDEDDVEEYDSNPEFDDAEDIDTQETDDDRFDSFVGTTEECDELGEEDELDIDESEIDNIIDKLVKIENDIQNIGDDSITDASEDERNMLEAIEAEINKVAQKNGVEISYFCCMKRGNDKISLIAASCDGTPIVKEVKVKDATEDYGETCEEAIETVENTKEDTESYQEEVNDTEDTIDNTRNIEGSGENTEESKEN